MSVESFEKDDDSNGHIDFITSASVCCVIADVLQLHFNVLLFVFYKNGGSAHLFVSI